MGILIADCVIKPIVHQHCKHSEIISPVIVLTFSEKKQMHFPKLFIYSVLLSAIYIHLNLIQFSSVAVMYDLFPLIES